MKKALLLIILFALNTYAQIDFEPHIIVDASGGTNNPLCVFSADLDGDGDLDILSASNKDDKIAWYENTDGQGTFGAQQIISQNLDQANSVFAADIDGDGKMDVLATGSKADRVVWYKNLDGQGNFGSEIIIATETIRSGSIKTADLDNDGDMDVLYVTLTGNKIVWHENTDGLGTFGPQQVLSNLFISPLDISTGDINGDGYTDVLSGSDYYQNSSVVWFKNNNGQGNFYQQQELSSQVEEVGDAILMDVDNDGDLDIVVASNIRNDNKIVWFKNLDGHGIFPLLSQTLMTVGTSAPDALYSADVDNDNDMDLVVGSKNNGLYWFKNNGSGNFGTQQSIDNQVTGVTDVEMKDLDNDGKLDLVLSAGLDDKVAWHNNTNGQGNFGPANELANINGANGVICVYSIDLDSDGDKDILSVLRWDNRITWQENLNGQGTFSELKTIAILDTPMAVFAGDLDGDGKNDVLAASKDKLTWHKNLDNQGNFGTEQIINNITTSETIYAIDIDDDGDLDIFSSEGMNTYWQENTDGLGTFGPVKLISDQFAYSDSILSKDIDNDGHLDLILSYWGDGNIVWFKNLDGQGNFDQGTVVATLLNPDSVYAADLDTDGDIDIVTVDYFTDEVLWYENLDGNGTFGSAHSISNTTEGAWSVVAADFDNDGDMDIACTAYLSGKVIIFENNGTGNFDIEHTIISEFTSPYTLFADDYNNDGKMDIVSASYYLDQIVWFENQDMIAIAESAQNIFSIYPNPTNGLLNIKSKSPIAEITIYNSLGQLLFTSEVKKQLNLSFLSEGIYFVKISNENGQTETKKVIKN